MPKRIILQNEDGTNEIFIPQTSPDPTPDPPTPAPARSNIGFNLPYLDYYGTERPFVDLSMQMSRWQPTMPPGEWGKAPMPPVGLNGFPISTPAGTYLGSIIDLSPGDASEISFTTMPINGMTVDGQLSPTSWRKTQPYQRLLARVNKPINQWFVTARADESNSQLFQTRFLNRAKTFGTIRFMNWNRTNQVHHSYEWANRTPPTYYTQADSSRPVSLELQARLCKLSGARMWHTFHHLHSDEYIRRACELFLSILGPDHPMIFEWSNEVWNWGFQQAHYAAARSPKTNSPWEYNLLRSGEMAQIVKLVLPKAKVTYGAQAVNWGHIDYIVSKGVQIPSLIDSFAIAPYFGNPLTEAAKLSVDAMLNECEASINAYGNHCTEWRKRGEKYGKKVIIYECGQHVSPTEAEKSNTALVDRMIAVNRHPRMYDLYRRYLGMIDSVLDKPIACLFESVSSYSKHGCWGHQEFEGHPLSTAHKMRAVYDHMGVPTTGREAL